MISLTIAMSGSSRRPLPPELSLSDVLGVEGPEPAVRTETPAPVPEHPEPDLARVDPTRFHRPRSQRRSKAEARAAYRRAPDPAGPRPTAPPETDTLSVEELDTLERRTAGMARVVPALLIVGVGLASLFVVLRLLGGGGGGTTPHVELELLAVPGHAAPTPDPVRTAHFVVETEPSGVLILHGQRVLGATPLEVDLPVAAPSKVAVRLSGPRFQPWVGEVAVSPTADFRVSAALESR